MAAVRRRPIKQAVRRVGKAPTKKPTLKARVARATKVVKTAHRLYRNLGANAKIASMRKKKK